jgi:SsrA-binding protein
MNKKDDKKHDRKPDAKDRLIATHHEARRDYHVLESYEAGLALVGCEVKSLRAAKVTLAGSFAHFEKGELFVRNLYIAPYEQGNRENPDPMRVRKLLLKRAELDKLEARVSERRLTLIPLKLYFSLRGLAKMELGLCKGKTHGDQREDIKKRDASRDIDRALKHRNR